MARGNLPLTQLSRAGVAPASEVTGDASNNHQMSNDGKSFLLVRNSNGGSTARVVSLVVNGNIDGQSPSPKTVSIPAGASRYIGPFPVSLYSRTLLINVDNAELKLSAYHVS